MTPGRWNPDPRGFPFNGWILNKPSEEHATQESINIEYTVKVQPRGEGEDMTDRVHLDDHVELARSLDLQSTRGVEILKETAEF